MSRPTTSKTLTVKAKARDALYRARALVAAQAKDPALWFEAETAPEAYLQAALRRLHKAVEGKP